ncbi:putative TIR domain-containing protein [Rosa chinensis]|uniref:Putative TIR domain-containing protein n=1 Tax=Rosa chinensis TaxID=74649 RepID=A0A2P6PS78_ROSCH|nr:putative TIR domain-containing protein [Rosa chinensis]
MKDRNRILAIFHDVNLFHVQKQRGTFEKAFDEHEERFQDDLEKVQAWRDALTNVCNFAGWTSNDRNEVQVIEEITEALWNKLHSRLSPMEKQHPTSTHNLVAFTSISVVYRDHNHPIHITYMTATSVEWNFFYH